MDFLSKLFKPTTKSGSGPSPGNNRVPVPVKSEHETYVEFAREFVEELVENLPEDSGKNTQGAKFFELEHSTSLASIVASDKSFDTALPDLLQPESVYKKQTDTDTDTSHTTEYESALETDAQDNSSINDGLISDEIFDCAENVVDRSINTADSYILLKSADNSDILKPDEYSKSSSFTKIEEKSDEESILMPSDGLNDSDLSFSNCVSFGEQAGISDTLPPLDITSLCAGIANLDLDTSAESSNVSVHENIFGTPNQLPLNDSEIYAHYHTTLSGDGSGFEREKVQNDTLIFGEVDTIHLIETDEHELSVLIIDKTVDRSEFGNILLNGPLVENVNNSVDTSLSAQNSNTFQEDTQYPIIHSKPEELENSPFKADPKTNEVIFQLPNEEINLNSTVVNTLDVTLEAVEDDLATEGVNLAFETANPGPEAVKDLLTVEEQTVNTLDVTFETVKYDLATEGVNLAFETADPGPEAVKEPLETVEQTKLDVTLEVVEDNLATEGVNLAFETADPGLEAIKEPLETVNKLNVTLEVVKDNLATEIVNLAFETADPGSEAFEEPLETVEEQTVNKLDVTLEVVKDNLATEIVNLALKTADPGPEAIKQPLETVDEQTVNTLDITFDALAFEGVNLTFKSANPGPEAIKESLETVEEQTVNKLDVTFETVKDALATEKVNLAFETADPGPEAIKEPLETVEEQTVNKLDVTFETVKDALATEKVNLAFETADPGPEAIKEPLETVEQTVNKLDVTFETVENNLAIEGVHLAFESADPGPEAFEEPLETVDEQTVNKLDVTFETVKDALATEEVHLTFKTVGEGFEAVNKSIVKVVNELILEPTVEAVRESTVETVNEFTVNANKQPVEEHKSLIDNKLPISSNSEHSFEVVQVPEELKSEQLDIKDSNTVTPSLLQKESTVEQLMVNADSIKKPSVKTPLGHTASIHSTSSALLEQYSPIGRVCEKLNSTKIVDDEKLLIQQTSLLDFGEVAAEAANVSNDFLNASHEIEETNFAKASSTVFSLAKSSAMMDTESTQKLSENVSSVPLDVKWLAESQNKNRNSSVGSVKPADLSPMPNNSTAVLKDTKSVVVDCLQEDPFKRRSLLRNSPPREGLVVPKGNDGIQRTFVEPTSNKAADESSDAKNNHSEAGPDTAETCNIHGDELFQDSSAFDFLSSMASSQPIRDYRSESLYVKFDPLVGSTAVTKTDRNIPLPPTFQESMRSGDTAVHTLAVASSPRNHATPTKNPALDLVDRLISLSPSPRRAVSPKPPPVVKEEPVHTPLTREQEEMIEELHLLRELLDRQDQAHQDELSKHQQALEQQLSKHKEELEELQNQLNVIKHQNQQAEEREQRLSKKINEKAQGQKQMSMIMEEYEKTISRLVAEKEAEHQAHELEKEAIIKEKDLALGHLTNIEIAFSDVHMKYERSKNVIEGFKKNEEVLQGSLAEFEATIHKQEQKYELLKSHAMQQLESANQELDCVRRSQQTENAKLKAMLKKSELKTSSLEEMLDQKIKENQELASICDDLISKVGN